MEDEIYHKDLDGNLILDGDEQPIPITVCLCFARSSSECMCGAWDLPIEGGE
jgi:hypothetical protein